MALAKLEVSIMNENNMLDKDFKDVINNIKQEIQNTQYKVAIESNINLISMYFRLGKILNDNYEYGNKFIDVGLEIRYNDCIENMEKITLNGNDEIVEILSNVD